MSDMSIEFLPLAMANPLAEMTKRAEAAEAKLRFVDEYGSVQYEDAQSRGAKDVCLYQTFEAWLETHGAVMQ